MNIEDLLVDDIDARFKKLRTKNMNVEEEKAEVDNVVKLIHAKIELDQAHDEICIKKQQLKNEKKHKIIDYAMKALEIAVPLAFSYFAMKASFKFEKDGTITTILGREYVRRFGPKK